MTDETEDEQLDLDDDETDETEDDFSYPNPELDADADDDAPKEAKLRKRAQRAEHAADMAQFAFDLVSGERDALEKRLVADYIEREHGVRAEMPMAIMRDENIAALTDDGMLNVDAIRNAVETAVERFGLAVTPRMPRPNPAQGTSGGEPGPDRTGTNWEEAFTLKKR